MINARWLDKNGLVRTHLTDEHSGNGLLFSTIYILFNHPEDRFLAANCFNLWQKDKGVLFRTPDNKFGQESHDNYLALGVLCLFCNNKKLARSVIWSCIKKFGFMQNDFHDKDSLWKSQLLRFPHIWIVLLSAAAPNVLTFFIARVVLSMFLHIQKIELNDQSGLQLQWLNAYAIHLLGSSTPMESLLTRVNMRDAMDGYYDSEHDILEGYKNFQRIFK